MTQIILKNSIDNIQMSVLMGLFNSWNANVEIKVLLTFFKNSRYAARL